MHRFAGLIRSDVDEWLVFQTSRILSDSDTFNRDFSHDLSFTVCFHRYQVLPPAPPLFFLVCSDLLFIFYLLKLDAL